jgi:hypothetical protein
MIIPIKTKPQRPYGHIISGTVTIGGKTCRARSSWEANIAAYFEFLKRQGSISEWKHEPKTFWFNGIKRGVVSYLPDFEITENSGKIKYVEVKGFMDKRSATKLKRMKIYFPDVTVEIINKKRYDEIKSKASFIKDWGLLNRK